MSIIICSRMNRFVPSYGKPFPFPALPDASSLIEAVTEDPNALQNQQHDPGIYDADGDYVPQFSDDPGEVAGMIQANEAASAPETAGASSSSETPAESSSSETPAESS